MSNTRRQRQPDEPRQLPQQRSDDETPPASTSALIGRLLQSRPVKPSTVVEDAREPAAAIKASCVPAFRRGHRTTP
jgi:hypothetical protein